MTKDDDKKALKHKKSMQKQKTRVDEKIAQAKEDRSVLILLTGDGKGKSTSGFGTIFRALGYGQKVGVVQFIKGARKSGEELLLKERFPEVTLYQMGTGFTWESQDREKDIAAAETTWIQAEKLLTDDSVDLVLLDELTYMLSYKYLEEEKVLAALASRPANQSVIVTGRGGGSALRDLADTVSEVKVIKHAFHDGVMARKGVDY